MLFRSPHGIRHGEEALIPDILFVRTRVSRLQPLLARVSDLAWCYRTTSERGYARIPDCEMQAFQLAIGIFTPETDVRPLGTVPPRPGQQVVVIGGPFAGRSGRYLSTVTPITQNAYSDSDTKNTQNNPEAASSSLPVLYRLILPADNGIEWEADLDPRLVGLAAE